MMMEAVATNKRKLLGIQSCLKLCFHLATCLLNASASLHMVFVAESHLVWETLKLREGKRMPIISSKEVQTLNPL
jgi:hypothetical protein